MKSYSWEKYEFISQLRTRKLAKLRKHEFTTPPFFETSAKYELSSDIRKKGGRSFRNSAKLRISPEIRIWAERQFTPSAQWV